MKRQRPAYDGPLRAAIYSRVSTEDQAADGTTSLDVQERECGEYISYRKWTVAGVWRDEGASGKDFNRPKWRKLREACARGEIDVVVCSKHDRYSRSATLAGTEKDALAAFGTSLVLLNLQVDTSTPNGEFMFNMLMAGAQWERRTIVERMANGQYGAVRIGRWPSSAAGAPFGLRKEGIGRESHLVIDEREAAIVRKAASLLVDDRLSKQQVADTLNGLGLTPRKAPIWTADNLHQMLSEPARMGACTWGKEARIFARTGAKPHGEPTPVAAPAVLTSERFEQVQRALARRSYANPIAQPRTYVLSGRITSPCGLAYHGRMRNDRGTAAYRCANLKWRADRPTCDCPPLPAPDLEGRVWAEVAGLMGDQARLRELAEAYFGATEDGPSRESELAALERQIGTLQGQLAGGIAKLLRTGLDADAVVSAMAQLEAELVALRERRDAIESACADEQAMADSIGQITAQAGRIDTDDPSVRAEILERLGVRVTVLDRTRAPALRLDGVITGVIGSEETAGQVASAGNPDGDQPRPVTAGITLPFSLNIAA